MSIRTCTMSCLLGLSMAVTCTLGDAQPLASMEADPSSALGSLSPALASSFCQLFVGSISA